MSGEKILIQDLFKITNDGILLKNISFNNNGEATKIWANISLEDINLTKFENRYQLIRNMLSIVRKNDINGINVYVYNEDNNLQRFIIELAPRLRELGIKTNIIVNKDFKEKEVYEDIVDYIIVN